MEAKHTPGPWLFGDWSNNTLGVIDEAGWVDVWVRLPDGTKSVPIVSCRHQQEIENARLIVAAPELLADLTAAAAQLRQYETLHRAKNTEDSLRKAEVNAELATRFEQTIAKATS